MRKNLDVPKAIESIKGHQCKHDPVGPFHPALTIWHDKSDGNVHHPTQRKGERKEHKVERLPCFVRHMQEWCAEFALRRTRVHSQRYQERCCVVGNTQREAESGVQCVRRVEFRHEIQQVNDKVGQRPQDTNAFVENRIVVEVK